MNLEHLKIISAGAGSGKTYRLTQEMVSLLQSGTVRAGGIIATTFTRKAAAELQERVRVKLLSEGLTEQADELTNALIGTVHGLGVKLLKRFAFEAGVSPKVDILPENIQQQMFNQALAAVLDTQLIERMDNLCDQLGLTKKTVFYDWRKEVKYIVDVARANDFDAADLRHSANQSVATFMEFLPDAGSVSSEEAHRQLRIQLEETADLLSSGEDTTKITAETVDKIRQLIRELALRKQLYWHQWATITKYNIGAKSRDTIAPLKEAAALHECIPAFRDDIAAYIQALFQTAIAAVEEFDAYKKRRGLIDYTDMEVLVNRLLDHPQVKAVLADELDLLMVDEFQDTSPIQLEIFLKLSRLAKYSVWVGDPKQSIYGFRGAEPRLMDAIIQAAGGVKPENIQIHSWRSRRVLVDLSNAIFCQAFPQLPPEQVALQAVRTPEGSDRVPAEPAAMENGFIHWHFVPEDGGRPPGEPWMEDCLAQTLRQWLEGKVLIQPKGSKTFAHAQPGDVAILCRSNAQCAKVAEALHKAGMKAAMARSGLLETAECRLILACLKYILHEEDSLSVAEILVLASQVTLEDLVEDRLQYMEEYAETPVYQRPPWASGDDFISILNKLRPALAEASTAETLHQVLEELDLRRCMVRWGNSEQRLGNVDQLRKLALDYETDCNNTHTAASLGGFLLWLNTLASMDADLQAAGEDPQAVNVLTYHKSKGLEWPVVICYELEQSLKADLWGIDIVAEKEEVDLNHVLKGRWLRYWVNPYSDQYRSTPLLERMQASHWQESKRQAALAEEARLLYVGLTRARDYLILPTRVSKEPLWLNRVFNQGNETPPLLDANTHETPWEWEDRFIDKTTSVYPMPRQLPASTRVLDAVPFLEKPLGDQTHPYRRVDGC
ncbi:MAG: UvrD-helicase domain-containing protein [Saprospiraceae bacterium]